MIETIIQFLLTGFITFITPIPWWLIVFHFLVQKRSKFLTYISYFSIVIVWVALGSYTFPNRELLFDNRFSPNLITQVLGIVFIVLAAMVDVNVMRTLGLKRLAMLPEFGQKKISESFVAHGIYKYSRHPRYVEYMLVSVSAGLFFGYLFMFVFLAYLILSFWLATKAEEHELVQRFGESYREYQHKVPRFFIF